MGMVAVDLGLGKKTLFANPKGNEMFYHLRFVGKGNTVNIKDLVFDEIEDTDDCKIIYKGKHITTTSTFELKKMMHIANYHTMTLVTVHTPQGLYYAAVHQDLLQRKFVGVLTDVHGRASAFVQRINNTLWANVGHRIIQLEDIPKEDAVELSSQEAIKFLNANPMQFRGIKDEVVYFK